MKFIKRLTLLSLISLLFSGVSMSQYDREYGPFMSRSEVIGQNGMVATSQPLAAQIGLDILKAGGNAFDAAIATNAAMGLMEPTGNGIGGDLFAIVWHAESGKIYALNSSGRSPMGLSYDQLKTELEALGSETIPPLSPLSVSVPGAVDGWFELHDRFGSMPMDQILAPAIYYAENGFPVPEVTAYYWRGGARRLVDQPGDFRKSFTIDGRGPEKGEIMRNPDLGNTYRILGEKGRDAFYEGELAEIMDAYMREIGGYLRKEDFAAHTSTWHDPESTTYRGYTVHQIGMNNQGTAVLQMLNILENFDLKSLGFNSAETLHLMRESKKLAVEDRAKHYSDPDFNAIPMDSLLSKHYAKERAAMIGERAQRRITSGVEALKEGGTIYLTTADKHGNMVSFIQSNFRGMGTGLVPPGLGFSFHNRGELYSMDPGHPNVYAPGKRPFHTIIPGFVTKDGKPLFTLGVMGGEFQPMGHVQILTNIIDFGMNIQEAGDAIRWLHTNSTEPTDAYGDYLTDGGRVQFEYHIDPEVVKALRAKGHQVQVGGGFYGRYQGIWWDENLKVYFGASESRTDGQAVSY